MRRAWTNRSSRGVSARPRRPRIYRMSIACQSLDGGHGADGAASLIVDIATWWSWPDIRPDIREVRVAGFSLPSNGTLASLVNNILTNSAYGGRVGGDRAAGLRNDSWAANSSAS